MGYTRASRFTLFLVLSLLGPIAIIGLPPEVYAEQYALAPFPSYSQEGSNITLILSVSGAPLTMQIDYEFVFRVQDPSTTLWTSSPVQYRKPPGQVEFYMIVTYPSAQFADGGRTSLVGVYFASASQSKPCCIANVDTTAFFIGLTDRPPPALYQRTETVSIRASGYAPGESVSLDIRTVFSSTLAWSDTQVATEGGIVTSSWKIPKDATTTEDYAVRVTGSTTPKTPADAQTFSVRNASMSIPTFSPNKSTFQRTEELLVSFSAVYPSGENANSGSAKVNMTRPDGSIVTVTASYEAATQSFVARYKTSATEQVGSWTALLAVDGYDDGFGNHGPISQLSTSTELRAATLSIVITMDQNKNSFAVNELIQFQASIRYPDGMSLQAGQVSGRLSLGSGSYNASVPLVFDSGLGLWVGTYTPKGDEPAGLWSLTITASDSAQPGNSGSASRAIQIQAAQTGGILPLPLFYFGLLAAIIAAVIGAFLVFRRHRVTHARLKIDLEAVKAEAGRIESQEFFQSVKDQLRKEKDD